jgi:gliding motility-associated-like protein
VLFRLLAYNSFLILITFLPLLAKSQGIGQGILNVTFGEGKDNPGPPLSAAHTSFSFSPDACPVPGTYTITNSLYRCPANVMGRSIDHTPGSSYGYMMLVHDTPSYQDRILYIDTLRESLCPGTSYEFSAEILNTDIPGYCNYPTIHFPNFALSVETTSGQVLQLTNTGPMLYDYAPPSSPFPPKFHFKTVDFILPPGINDLVLKIIDIRSGYTPCGYSFAMDDIRFTAIGPEADITFDGADGPELVKSVCYQDNKTISMKGSVGAYYTNTALQWQQSIDSGLTWTDIPGANSLSYSNTFSTPDTFLFRLSAAEASKISNPNCRVVSNVLRVEVEAPPHNFTVSSNSPVCEGNILQFNVTGGASYEWTGPNGFYDNVYYAHVYTTTLADSGWYYVTVSSPGGCSTKDSIYATIIASNAKINLSSDTSICKGNSVQLTASAAAGATYSWSPANGLSDASINNPVATPATSTLYTVKVTFGGACSDSASTLIKIKNPIPVKAGISGSGYLCRPYDSISLNNTSTGNIAIWRWDFGNGRIDTSATPGTQYYSLNDNDFSYNVRLIVADTAGCGDTTNYLIKVVDNCYIAVPTGFTPNGDGLNDYLYPLNAYKATNLLFKVYNRSGQLIFETRDWTKKWDGRFNGTPQPSGVYVWMLEYTDERGKKISLKGTTALIR